MKRSILIGHKHYSLSSDDDYLGAMGDTFEPYMVELYRVLIGPNDIVADIGANIGLTAILFSSLAHKVFAFEPSPSTYRILLDNVTKADVTNVEMINLGLGVKREYLTITFAKSNRSGGYVSNKIRPSKDHVTEKIQLDTLDRYFEGYDNKPNFLKIDVEGFEQHVIEGGRKIIEHNKPIVVLEMNHFCLDVLQRITIPDYLDFMRNVFPFLYAVDADNASIADLHNLDDAYAVMNEHVVRHRFPNLVGGFDISVGQTLNELAMSAVEFKKRKQFPTPEVVKPQGFIQAERPPEKVVAGDLFDISITIRNDGDEPWYSYGTHPVYLCYHWQKIDGQYLTYGGIRTALKVQIAHHGEAVEEVVQVVAPTFKGQFKLILTFVQEGICWFEDKGFGVAILEFEVL